MKIKDIFQDRENKRDIMINFRVTESEQEMLKGLAIKFTDGNVARLVRKAMIDILPNMIKDEKKKK